MFWVWMHRWRRAGQVLRDEGDDMTPDTMILLSRETLTFGSQMRRRHPAAVVFFGLATLGVYWAVWICRISQELHDYDERIEVNPNRVLAGFALGLPLIAPTLLALVHTAARVRRAQRAAGLAPTCRRRTGLLLWACLGVGAGYYQAQLNRVIDRYGAPADTEVFHYA